MVSLQQYSQMIAEREFQAANSPSDPDRRGDVGGYRGEAGHFHLRRCDLGTTTIVGPSVYAGGQGYAKYPLQGEPNNTERAEVDPRRNDRRNPSERSSHP